MGAGEKIAVVGAGVFGAWTAHHLQQKGHQVALIDAWGPAHSRSSSGGESRLIRAAYGPDAIYTRMAANSLPQWKALSDQSGLPLLVQCGILFFFTADQPYAGETLAAHRELGLATELIDRTKLARRFPMFDFDGIDVGLYEPGFGALMARRSVITLVDQFVRRGGTFIRGLVEAQNPAAARFDELRLSSGDRIQADRFVFAAGPWLPKLFPDVVGARIRPTRQEIFYFGAPAGDRGFVPDVMPGWADFNGGDMFYGTPDLDGRGVKFAHDRHGIEVDPDTQSRQPSETALAEIIAFRDRRFPLLRNAPLIGAEVCQYENSSNGDFLIDLHPAWPNVLLVGGGSGHGFKHGPEVGRYATTRLFAAIEPEPRFSLASKSVHHHREVH